MHILVCRYVFITRKFRFQYFFLKFRQNYWRVYLNLQKISIGWFFVNHSSFLNYFEYLMRILPFIPCSIVKGELGVRKFLYFFLDVDTEMYSSVEFRYLPRSYESDHLGKRLLPKTSSAFTQPYHQKSSADIKDFSYPLLILLFSHHVRYSMESG